MPAPNRPSIDQDPLWDTPEPLPFPNWSALRRLLALRGLIAAGLILTFSLGGAQGDAALIWAALSGYLVLLLAGAAALLIQWPGPERQVQLSVFVDIIVFTLLMHAAGGVTSGLGLLLAIAVASGALLMEGRQSLFFASLAALAVIGQPTFAQLYLQETDPGFTQAGLLGITFFTVALLAQILYRRVRAAEWLAARRKVDIADLSKLNEFIIQSMATGILVVDGERHIRLVNVAASRLLGRSGISPGSRLATLSPDLSRWLDASVAASREEARRRPATIEIGNRELRPSLQWLGEYRASGVLIFLEDQQELTKQAQQIKLASLGTLTASIAHNIRNPLSSISHAAQLLAESPDLGDDDRHLLDIIRRNGARIEEIIQSVLQLSRRRQPEPEQIRLTTWLRELCDDFATSHGAIQPSLAIDEERPESVVSVDPRHLSQILINLCENAIKHGSPGHNQPAEVEVRLRHGRGAILIEVLDEGPGIPEDKAQEIFSPFYTTSASGTGLGLYIARELAETNGILLEYIARKPRGSCFRINIPI
ncbi:ATP-binding protein [Thioalkalicoccus limnaeus]|uniref:histidine kinase n=1 Tax=Thioalkalicoccus limnaeus TaxID=120681 RepID=A0ABV4BEI8_9GAMM